MADAHGLTAVLARFASLLVRDYDVPSALYELCDAALNLLEVDGSGVLLLDVDDELRYAVASDPGSAAIERIQLELGEGPCIKAHASGRPVLVEDLSMADDCLLFAERAEQHGVHAVFTFPLRHRNEGIGVIDLYRRTPGPLTERQRHDAAVLADMATTLVLNARSYDDVRERNAALQRALDFRIVMEQAKGRVAERLGISMDEADEVIHNAGQRAEMAKAEVIRAIAGGRLDLRTLLDRT